MTQDAIPTAVVIGVGAERGVGAALCRRFAAEGYHVLVAGRTPEKIAQVVRTIEVSGGSAEAVATDVTIEADIVRLFDRAMAPGKGRAPADLVVFNAGNNQMIDFRELSAAQFEAFWRVGCFAGFLVGREAAKRLVPLGRGTVIFTGASGSLRGKPGFAHFAAAKAGLAHDRAEHGAGLRSGGYPRRPCRDRRRHQRRAPPEPPTQPSPRSAARTGCSASTPSPRPIGRSTASRAPPGRRKSICGRSRRISEEADR